MKGERKSIIILCIYVFIMLIVCGIATSALKRGFSNENITSENIETKASLVTEIVYIPIFSEANSDSTTETEHKTETETQIQEYFIKSYEGKIGVFTEDTTLVRVIDVYIKTLPKADRRLLEKGFSVIGEAELRAVIQDYTG